MTLHLHADAFARALCLIRGAEPATLDFYEPFIKDRKLETMAARAVSGH